VPKTNSYTLLVWRLAARGGPLGGRVQISGRGHC